MPPKISPISPPSSVPPKSRSLVRNIMIGNNKFRTPLTDIPLKYVISDLPQNNSSPCISFQPFDVRSSSSRVARRFSHRRNGDSRSGTVRSTLNDVVMVPSNQMVPTCSTTLIKDLSNSGSGENRTCWREYYGVVLKYVGIYEYISMF